MDSIIPPEVIDYIPALIDVLGSTVGKNVPTRVRAVILTVT